MKDSAYYIKTVILMFFLIFESQFLIQELHNYIRSEDYFTPSVNTLVKISAILLVLIYTYSLTVGAWGKWEQYIIVPLPISLGIFMGVLFLDPTHAVLMAALAFLLLSYDVAVATHIKNQLIKFSPVTVLRFSTKGILFLYALLAAVLVFLHSADKNNAYNLGDKVADFAERQFSTVMKPELDPDNLPSNLVNELEGKGLPPDPEMFGMLGGMQGDTNSVINGLPSFNLDLRDTVKTEVDNIVEPYKQFIPPLIALLVFALVRFLGSIAHFVFNLTAPILFTAAKKIGFLHTLFIPVQKEELSFTATREEIPKA